MEWKDKIEKELDRILELLKIQVEINNELADLLLELEKLSSDVRSEE